MSTFLRISGRDFDVDECLRLHPNAAVERVWRQGERRRAAGAASERSGLQATLSAADFGDLEGQIADAIGFMSAHMPWVQAVVAFPGVEFAVADFGVETSPPHWASFRFRPELTRLLSAAGVTLEISVYPRGDMEADDEEHVDGPR